MLLEALGLYTAYKVHKISNDGVDSHVYMLESQQYDKSIGRWTDWKAEPRYMFKDSDEAEDFAEELQERLNNTYRYRVVPYYVE